jgi:hypothetical protein
MPSVFRGRRLLGIVLVLVGIIAVAATGGDAGNDHRERDEANVRVTPPVFNNTGNSDESSSCPVVNISGKTRTVVLEAFDNDGTLLESLTSALDPGHTVSIFFSTERSFYCKFTVKKGAKSDIRGAAAIGNLIRNFLSVPAE